MHQFPDYAEERFDQVCDCILRDFSDVLLTKLGSGPHFMMIFAAVAHALFSIPEGEMGGNQPAMPPRDPRVLTDIPIARENLLALARIFDTPAEKVPEYLTGFKVAIAGTTQRIRSRSVRFSTIYRALLPDPIQS